MKWIHIDTALPDIGQKVLITNGEEVFFAERHEETDYLYKKIDAVYSTGRAYKKTVIDQQWQVSKWVVFSDNWYNYDVRFDHNYRNMVYWLEIPNIYPLPEVKGEADEMD